MSKFTIRVVEQPVYHCAGIKARMTMEECMIECPKLWGESFSPRMGELSADPRYPGISFGIAAMIDESTMDYWAAMPIREGATIPKDMDSLVVKGGLYAECPVNSIAELGEAFCYIYGEWNNSNGKYLINMSGWCYELYKEDYITTGKVIVYCPVLTK